MERNEQDQILVLAGNHGIEPEWVDPGDGTGYLEFFGTLAGFVSFADTYTKSEWYQWDVYELLKSSAFSEDVTEEGTEFTGTPDSFWAFVDSLN